MAGDGAISAPVERLPNRELDRGRMPAGTRHKEPQPCPSTKERRPPSSAFHRCHVHTLGWPDSRALCAAARSMGSTAHGAQCVSPFAVTKGLPPANNSAQCSALDKTGDRSERKLDVLQSKSLQGYFVRKSRLSARCRERQRVSDTGEQRPPQVFLGWPGVRVTTTGKAGGVRLPKCARRALEKGHDCQLGAAAKCTNMQLLSRSFRKMRNPALKSYAEV